MKNFFSEIKNSYLEHRLLFNLIILLGLILCSMVTQYMSVVLIAVILVMAFTSNETEAISLFAFLSPFSNVLRIMNVEAVFIGSLALYIIVSLINKLIKKQFKINIILLILTIIFVIYSLLPVGEYNALRFGFLGIILLTVLVVSLLWQIRDSLSFKHIIYSMFIGLIISVGLAFVVKFFPNANNFAVNYKFNSGIRFAALFSNPNFLSGQCAFLMAIFVVYIYHSIDIKMPTLCMLTTCVLGFLTYSKTFMIIAFVTMLIFIIVLFIKLKTSKRKKIYGICLGLLVLSVIAVSIILFLKRLDFSKVIDLSELTTYRSDIWKIAIEKVTQSPLNVLFGLGVGAPRIMLHGILYGCHSTYIELLYRFGIIGSLIIIAIIITMLIIYFKTKTNKFNIFNWVPLFIVALYSVVGTTINVMVFFVICLSIVMVDYNPNKNYLSKKID